MLLKTGVFKAILLESHILFRTNKIVNPAFLPRYRLYVSDEDKQLKKEKKLAKKIASLGAEPYFFQTRSNNWTELKKKHDEQIANREKQIINVTLLDGKIVEGFSWEMTPLDVAKQISNALAAEVYIAKANDLLWDVERPLEMDTKIQLFKFDSPDAKAALWKTAALTLAETLERLYGMDNDGMVCNVGTTQTGFFADIHLKDKTINRKDFAAIEEGISKNLAAQRFKVERIEVSKSDASELFSYNPFKLKAINASQDDRFSIYRCGSFLDISSTPLTRHNKKVNAVKMLKVESILFFGESMQRIHGVAFPSQNELKDFLKNSQLG